MKAPTVEEIKWIVAGPGREAVLGMVKLCNMPKEHWGRMLPMLFELGPNRTGWQYMLHWCWRESSSAVVEAARANRATLREWFVYADFRSCRLPYLLRVINTKYKPSERMYRGGQGTAEELAQGFSWTPSLSEAVHYAYLRQLRHGPPVIISRTIYRDEIMMQVYGATAETVVIEPGFEDVVTLGEREIKAHSSIIAARYGKGEKRNEKVTALSEDEKLRRLLAGYEGEP